MYSSRRSKFLTRERLEYGCGGLLVLGAFFGWFLAAYFIWAPQESRLRNEADQRHAAKEFHLLTASMRGQIDEVIAAKEKDDDISLDPIDIWRDSLAGADSGYDSEPVDVAALNERGIRVISSPVAGSLIVRLSVSAKNGAGPYEFIAFALIFSDTTRHQALRLVAYSPATPNRFYVRDVSSEEGAERAIERTLIRHDWNGHFAPSAKEWPYVYKVQEGKSTLSRLKSREN